MPDKDNRQPFESLILILENVPGMLEAMKVQPEFCKVAKDNIEVLVRELREARKQ